MNHPNAMELEALACGEPLPQIAAHLDACEPCRAFVARAENAAKEKPRLDLAPILAAARRRERTRRGMVSSGAILLAAAALVLLWVGAGVAPRPSVPPAPVVMTTQMDTTFKGTMQVAVIRERGDAQERFTDTVHVQPGDRLRLEVALDRPRAILGAVLDEDGTYLELLTNGVRSAGTHFSDKSARIDARPMHGTILVGTPEAVGRARATGKLEDVATLRVIWENSP